MKSSKKSAPYYVPASIVKIFTIIVAGIFIVQSSYFLYQGIRQYLDNPNTGGYYGYFFVTQLLPVILFLLAYALNPRKLAFLARCFESLLFSIAGLTIWSLTTIISPLMFSKLAFGNRYALYEIISSLSLLVIYSVGLLWLRQSKKWR